MTCSSTTLEEENAQKMAYDLSIFLADTYLVYLKTQNFHWNVKDPRFHSLHEFFEEQYKSLAEATDEIAERIRTLNAPAPGSFKEFLELTRLEEAKGTLSADEMLKQLINNHQSIVDWLKPMIEQTAKLGDQGTSDLYIERLRAHQKTVWMLKSHFKNS